MWAFIIRIGFWGIFYYSDNKAQHSIGSYLGPYINKVSTEAHRVLGKLEGTDEESAGPGRNPEP